MLNSLEPLCWPDRLLDGDFAEHQPNFSTLKRDSEELPAAINSPALFRLLYEINVIKKYFRISDETTDLGFGRLACSETSGVLDAEIPKCPEILRRRFLNKELRVLEILFKKKAPSTILLGSPKSLHEASLC